jgi:antirestriction protein
METTVNNIASHIANIDNETPAIYVGTYAKYNNGSLAGAWLDLSTFDDFDDFLEVCRELHADEAAPEFMAQDFCNFPHSLYSECFSREDFDAVKNYAEVVEQSGNKEAVDAYVDNYGVDYIDEFADKYQGEYDSEEDFAEQLFEDCYAFDMPEFARRYFDIAAFARDLFICDYDFVDGYVFSCY